MSGPKKYKINIATPFQDVELYCEDIDSRIEQITVCANPPMFLWVCCYKQIIRNGGTFEELSPVSGQQNYCIAVDTIYMIKEIE